MQEHFRTGAKCKLNGTTLNGVPYRTAGLDYALNSPDVIGLAACPVLRDREEILQKASFFIGRGFAIEIIKGGLLIDVCGPSEHI